MRAPRAEAFVRRHASSWRRFREEAAACAKAGRVSPDRVIEFARRYRAVAADLSAARALGASAEVLLDLNALVSLAHGVVYRERVGDRSTARFPAVRFLLHELPALLRRERRLLGLAAALLIVPAIFAFLFVLSDSASIHSILPDMDHVIGPEKTGSINPMPLSFSSQLAIHNTLVCLMYFASGIAFGVGAAYFLALNGIVLGALAAHFANQGMLSRFWPQIVPHGVTEIFAMILSAAAGLFLARALWRPGEWSRMDALALAGRDAGKALLGVLVLLVFSGAVEGSFTRTVESDALRNLFGALSAAAMAAWLLRGAGDEARPPASAQTPPEDFSAR